MFENFKQFKKQLKGNLKNFKIVCHINENLHIEIMKVINYGKLQPICVSFAKLNAN